MKKLLILTLALLASLATIADEKESAASLATQEEELVIDIGALLDDLAEVKQQLAVCTNLLRYVERRCETDQDWRAAYHLGRACSTVQTNEYGIAYKVDIYKDGYVYAEYKNDARGRKDDIEAKMKEAADHNRLIAKKQKEMQDKMDKALLPAAVYERVKQREQIEQNGTKTVVKVLRANVAPLEYQKLIDSGQIIGEPDKDYIECTIENLKKAKEIQGIPDPEAQKF